MERRLRQKSDAGSTVSTPHKKRYLVRSQGRSHERLQERSHERSQERSHERSLERSYEQTQDRLRNNNNYYYHVHN